jgi:TrmH family RNA methyltransferase
MDICCGMPSQALLKKIAALKLQKFRQKYGQFTVEGRKAVEEIIHSTYEVHNILATEAYMQRHTLAHNAELVSETEMARLSNFTTPPGIMAVAEMRNHLLTEPDTKAAITLCLDGISDPGNLGTLVRTADWFGMDQVVLSPDCTDFYNPKALSASMGSFTRCNFWYRDLTTFLADKNTAGCFLNGTDVANFQPDFPVFVVIGSESHGIRPELEKQIRQRITIPGYGKAESLNAGIAAGIVMEHLARLKNS